MRLFVLEHLSCGAVDLDAVPQSLACEGWAMCCAVIKDLLAAGHQVVTTHDSRLEAIPGAESVATRTEDKLTLLEHGDGCDGALIIAPETDGQLVAWRRAVDRSKLLWLGCSENAISITGDKLACAKILRESNIPTIDGMRPTGPCSSIVDLVIKTHDGAGSDGTFRVPPRRTIRPTRSEIVTRFIDGFSASVLAIASDAACIFCPASTQEFVDDQAFAYRGGSSRIPKSLDQRAQALARRAIEAIPGLRGFVGVDVVLSDDGDYVVEINPRLVTSYVGLRELCKEADLVRACLDTFLASEIRQPRWIPSRRVSFDTSGQVKIADSTEAITR